MATLDVNPVKNGAISQTPGNSPLTDIPAGYCPDNSGQWFVIPEGEDAGKKLFYYDVIVGQGEPEATVVCVHGNPECSYSYRHVAKQLKQQSLKCYRLVVMDHIGFGRSDQASFQMVDKHHATNLSQLVQFLDLQNVTLVVHDWGGPIGVGAFIKEYQRVSQLIVLNTTIFPIPKDGVTYDNFPFGIKFLSWAMGGRTVLNRFWGIHAAYSIHVNAKKLIPFVMDYIFYHIKSAFKQVPKTHRLFQQMFSSLANTRSSKRMVRQTPVWGHGYEYNDPTLGVQNNHEFYQYMQDNVTKAWGPQGNNIPVRLLFGDWDPLAKASVIKQWTNALPQLAGNIQIFPGVSHFVAEYKAKEIAEAIIDVANLN